MNTPESSEFPTVEQRIDIANRLLLAQLNIPQIRDMAVQAVNPHDRLMACVVEALRWLDEGAPGRAREALERGLRV